MLKLKVGEVCSLESIVVFDSFKTFVNIELIFVRGIFLKANNFFCVIRRC